MSPRPLGEGPGVRAWAQAEFWKSVWIARRAARSSVRESFQKYDPHRTAAVRAVPHQALVRIMFGCDKFCSYCIVPSVRGPEQSRPADEIEEEVRRLADDGCLEVTLIGQTVNSYSDTSNGRTMRLVRSACPAARDRGHKAFKIRDELSQAHDRRSVGGGPRFAEGLAVFAHSGPKRLERSAKTHEARLYGRGISRNARADPRNDSRRGCDQRFYRGFLRRD